MECSTLQIFHHIFIVKEENFRYNDSSIEMRDNMNLLNIITILLFGVVPFCFYLVREDKKDKKLDSLKAAFFTTLFSSVLTLICLWMSKQGIHIPSLLGGTFLNFVICWNLAKGNLSIKSLAKTAITLSLFFCSSLFQLIPITLFSLTSSNVTPQIETYLTCFSDIALVIILGFMYFDELKAGILKAKKNFNQFFDQNFKIWMIGFIGMMVSNLLIHLFAPSAVAGNENTVQGMIDISPLVMLLTAGVLAPIIEELTFRQAFKDCISNKTIFILTSGVIFGLLHVVFAYQSWIDFLYAIPYSCLGVAFAYMVSKDDNIFSSIFMHFLHNTMIIGISILTGMIIL